MLVVASITFTHTDFNKYAGSVQNCTINQYDYHHYYHASLFPLCENSSGLLSPILSQPFGASAILFRLVWLIVFAVLESLRPDHHRCWEISSSTKTVIEWIMVSTAIKTWTLVFNAMSDVYFGVLINCYYLSLLLWQSTEEYVSCLKILRLYLPNRLIGMGIGG